MTKAEELKSKTSLPLIMAPMFLVSTPALALAACAEGVVGSFPALNQRTSAGFEQWLIEMNTGLEKLRQPDPSKVIAPYAVNLILAHPRLNDDLALIVKHKVPVVITSLGINKDVIDAIHSYGGIVLHDVTNAHHARKAIAAGVDGIIAVAAGAGGHAGNLNPIALVDEIRSFYDGLLVLSGCMTAGSDILAAEAMGADFAYMGTRFLNTVESGANPEHKQMIIDAQASDLIYTSAISGVPANFLGKSLEKAGYDLEVLKSAGPGTGKMEPGKPSGWNRFWSAITRMPNKFLSKHFKKASGGKLKKALGEKAMKKEAATWATVWSAGQGVSNINDAPTVHDLIDRLKKEYEAAQSKLIAKFNKPQAKGPQTPTP
ncbi:MAG: nitronate monooxygenase [Alphaproteobacteria bacterium]|nr:nitronate monooxygenase [Alphaproteobacteria bacterium]